MFAKDNFRTSISYHNHHFYDSWNGWWGFLGVTSNIFGIDIYEIKIYLDKIEPQRI